MIEGVAVLGLAGVQRCLGRIPREGGPFRPEVVPGRQAHSCQHQGNHHDQNACRVFAPARQQVLLVELDDDHERVAAGGAVGRQDGAATFEALLEAAELALRQTGRQEFRALAGAWRPRCVAGKQERAVVAQQIDRCAGGIEDLAVVVDEEVAIHRGEQRHPTAVVQNDIARYRQETRGIRTGRLFGGAREAIVEVPAGPWRAHAKYRLRIGLWRKVIAQRHIAADVAHIGAGDDGAVRANQRERAQIGRLAQGGSEVLRRRRSTDLRRVGFRRVGEGQVDDVEALGQVVFERARVQGRRLEVPVYDVRPVANQELRREAEGAKGQGRHCQQKGPARARPPPRHVHYGETIGSSLWRRALSSRRPSRLMAATNCSTRACQGSSPGRVA